MWRSPTRIQQLGKIQQREALKRNSAARKVEDNGRLHRGEEAVARAGGGVIEKIGLIYPAVFAFCCSFTDNP